MFYVKNHKQLNIFDKWAYLGAKRRKELDQSWAGLFRNKILQTLPVEELRKHYHEINGRPTKELYSMLGMMILQQMHDLTDEQVVEQFSFNIKWHYALNITSTSDAYSYVSLRSIWEMRRILTTEDLHQVLFEKITKKLAKIFKVDLKKQRIDSVHIKSNMRHLGRISLFCRTIKKFLVNLKRHQRSLFDHLDDSLRSRYLNKKEEAVFALVKPSESHNTLSQLAQDMYILVNTFSAKATTKNMDSFKLLARLFQEQCIIEEHDGEKLVLAKPNKDVPSDSLQNPSDPDAGYSGHKGQGYSVQVMETYNTDSENKKLPLITYIDVQSANNSDAQALIPALDKAKSQGLGPDEVLADTAYGSDDNVVKAKEDYDVEVVAPLKNEPKGLSLADFTLDDHGYIVKCPQGKSPDRNNFKKRFSSLFTTQCNDCSLLKECPVLTGKKGRYYRYTLKAVRLAKRRCYEQSAKFRDRYRFRAGVEATMSEYDRRTGVKKLRVRGGPAVAFAAFMKALGINIKRAAAFKPRGKMPVFCLLRMVWPDFSRINLFKEQQPAQFSNILARLGQFRPNLVLRRKFA